MMSKPSIRTGAVAVYPDSEVLRKKYELETRFGDPYKLWSPGANGFIHLPRAICPIGVDERVSGVPVHVQSKVRWRSEEQGLVAFKAYELLKAGQSFIVEAATGFGKSVVGIHLITQVGKKTLVVVPKEDLLKHWREKIHEFTDLPMDKIGLIRQDTYHVNGCPIVVGMLHSLVIPGRYPPSLASEFGLVVFDEIHKLGAPTFSRACGMFGAKLRLGFSATPKRADGKELVFESHIGPVRIRSYGEVLVPKVLRYMTTWKVPRVPHYDEAVGRIISKPLSHVPGKTMHVVKGLVRHLDRNALITKVVAAAFAKKRRLVVFSDILSHLGLLRTMAVQAGVPLSETAFYVGGMKDAEKDQAIVKRVLFATYQMMDYGTDIPWLDMCVLGTPRADVVQAVGRIRREYEDDHGNKKPEPVVVDLVDADSPVFKGYATKRAEWYAKIGASVKRMALD